MLSRRDFVKGGVALVSIGTSAQSLLKGSIAFAAQNGAYVACLLYTSDAADERSSVDLGGRRILKKKKPYDISRTTLM